MLAEDKKKKKDTLDDLFHSLHLHCLPSPKKSNLLYSGEVLEYTRPFPKLRLHRKKSLHIPHHTTNKTIQAAKKNRISDTGNRTRALPALGSVLLDESGKS
jgi:hypothetical protein